MHNRQQKGKRNMSQNVLVVHGGGPTAVINASLYGVIEEAKRNPEVGKVYGAIGGTGAIFSETFIDLTSFNDEKLKLLLHTPASAIGSSRYPLYEKDYEKMVDIFKKHDIKYVLLNGGNGTMDACGHIYEVCKDQDIKVVGIPKTIDNDIWGTDFSFGFDSAVSIATDAIDRLHSTASSHKRVMVIEVMGHKAGWIALYSGMAGGGDVILIPEIPYNIHNIGETILNRLKKGKPYSIVVVAEGIQTDGRKRAAEYIAQEIEYETGIETRETVLGYIQRGGSPTPFDRNLSTRMGGHATELIATEQFGRMITLKGDEISSAPLEEIAGKLKLVTEDNDLVVQGRRMGICFG